MRELMAYKFKIANVMGLDINNSQHSIALADSLDGIENLEEFLQYCREKKSSIEYESKTEKLDTLAVRYKKAVEERELTKSYDAAELYAKTIADKVVQCRNFVEDKCIDFDVLVVEGKKFFEDHELRALEQVGTTLGIIEYSRTNRLAGEIYKAYIDNVRKNRQKALSSPGGTVPDVIKKLASNKTL